MNRDQLNTEKIRIIQHQKHEVYSADFYVKGVLEGNRARLSQAITLLESTLPDHQQLAKQIVRACIPYAGNSIRIGITGVPGVGKSTFIESFGKEILNDRKRLAILSVDPTSPKSKGSILGDKTRMNDLSKHADVFIRPSPSSRQLGGVNRATRESIILFEASGYDIILVETVGVGQSETDVHSMVDFFLLLLLTGAGDELQGIKKGVIEMADMIAINKADGKNKQTADVTASAYERWVRLFAPNSSGWVPPVVTCSGLYGENISTIWENISVYERLQKNRNFFYEKRQKQSMYWFNEVIRQQLHYTFYSRKETREKIKYLEKQIFEQKISAFDAAEQICMEMQMR